MSSMLNDICRCAVLAQKQLAMALREEEEEEVPLLARLRIELYLQVARAPMMSQTMTTT